jgi:DICT domain-containing protein
MYRHALEIAAARAQDLGDIWNLSRRDFDERQTIIFRTQVPCLEYVSLLIENAVLLRTNRAGRVYAGFEKLSRMEPVIDRYLRIADVSERVYVFGETDWKPPRHPNMRVIPAARNSELAREWFVIVDSPSLRVALVAYDEDGFDVPVLEQRTFSSFKTSDAALVAQLADAAEGIIDSSLAA